MNSQGARTKPIDRLRERPGGSRVKPEAAVPTGTANCGTEIIPDCIKALYNITDPTTATAGNSLGIFEDTDWYTQAGTLIILFGVGLYYKTLFHKTITRDNPLGLFLFKTFILLSHIYISTRKHSKICNANTVVLQI